MDAFTNVPVVLFRQRHFLMSPLRLYPLMFGGGVAAAFVGAVYWARSHRKSPEQREMERRLRLSMTGRITDGTVQDIQEYTDSSAAEPIQLLIYSYDVAGVSYECSQDITRLRTVVNLEHCKIGVPASVKYDPHNPGNSIVVAESWSGLRR